MAARFRARPSGGRQLLAVAIVAAETAGAIPHRVMAVEMLTNKHAQPRAGAAARLLGDLEQHAVTANNIVVTDDPFGFHTEDLVEIHAAQGHEGGGRIRRGPAEVRVERGNERVAEITVGGGDGADAGDRLLV